MNDNRPKVTVDQLAGLADLLEAARVPLIIWGQTGAGKTDVTMGYAEKYDRKLRIYYTAGLEPTEAQGLPFPKEGVELVEYKKTDIIHFEKGEKYLVFFDDFNRAPNDVRQAFLSMWNQSPYVGTHKVEGDIWLVAAMNDTSLQDNVIVDEIDDAFRTRGAQVTLLPNIIATGKHLQKKYEGNIVPAFLLSTYVSDSIDVDFANVYADNTYIIPTPRNFELLAKTLGDAGLDTLRDESHMLAVHALLGLKAHSSYVAFLEELDKLDPKLLLTYDKDIKDKLQELREAQVSHEVTTMLITSFCQAIPLLKPRIEKEKIRNFIRNLFDVTATRKGEDGKYAEVAGTVFSRVIEAEMEHVTNVLSEEEFIHDFLIYYNDVKKVKVQ